MRVLLRCDSLFVCRESAAAVRMIRQRKGIRGEPYSSLPSEDSTQGDEHKGAFVHLKCFLIFTHLAPAFGTAGFPSFRADPCGGGGQVDVIGASSRSHTPGDNAAQTDGFVRRV